MEADGMPSGIFAGINSGISGLEMLPQQHHHPQNLNRLQQNQPPHNPMVSFGQNQPILKPSYPFVAKSQTQSLTFSDEDDAGVDSAGGDAKRNSTSPWQRMKWTDNMVKLLIVLVFYTGDDHVVSEWNDVVGKKKGGSGGGGGGGVGALQKIGKWKSVSKAMMERGFYVSPQQCEDKFNDLNKRYKRVTDILGKGTSSKVVENQSLLETMDHLSPKTKEEVKKLLNSKHLFYREMRAYHNTCGGGVQYSAEVAGESSQIQQQSQLRKCLHLSENSPNVPNLSRPDRDGCKTINVTSLEDEEDDEEDEEDEDDYEVEDSARGHEHDSNTDVKVSSRKRPRTHEMNASIQELSNELNNIVQDGTKSSFEKRQWMRNRMMQLEEQQMTYKSQAFELETRKLKWLRFSSKKTRDMDVQKLANERMKLGNERMILLMKQKEVEMLDNQQQNQ